MLAPPGYTPLAALWTEFEQKCAQDISAHACGLYQTEEFLGTAYYPNDQEFGSPQDFVEEIFIQSLRATTVSLHSATGEIVTLNPNAADRSSDVFLRLSVFESTIEAENEAAKIDGPDWLRRMGSGAFVAWPDKCGRPQLWGETYPPLDVREVNEQRRLPFHTLPMWFERHRFVVPSALPPWTHNAIDEAFAMSTLPSLLSWSMCLDDSQAKRWRIANLRNRGYRAAMGAPAIDPPALGRPSKQDAARQAYWQLYPEGQHASWKHAVEAIDQAYGLRVSIKTLIRALKT